MTEGFLKPNAKTVFFFFQNYSQVLYRQSIIQESNS